MSPPDGEISCRAGPSRDATGTNPTARQTADRVPAGPDGGRTAPPTKTRHPGRRPPDEPDQGWAGSKRVPEKKPMHWTQRWVGVPAPGKVASCGSRRRRGSRRQGARWGTWQRLQFKSIQSGFAPRPRPNAPFPGLVTVAEYSCTRALGDVELAADPSPRNVAGRGDTRPPKARFSGVSREAQTLRHSLARRFSRSTGLRTCRQPPSPCCGSVAWLRSDARKPSPRAGSETRA